MSIDGSISLDDLNGGGGATPFTLSGVLVPGTLADGAGTLPEFTLEGAFADGVLLPPFTLSADAQSGNTLDGIQTGLVLQPFDVSGSFADGVTLLPFALAGVGESGAVITAALTLPAFDVAGSLEPPVALPAFSLAAVGLAGGMASGSIAPEAFALDASVGPQVDVTLEPFAVAASALTGTVAVGAVALAVPTVDAIGWQDTTADGAVALALYAVSGDASGTLVIGASITLEPFALDAAAASGSIATADLTVPLYALSGAMGFSVVGSATITLPAFVLAGGADNPAGPTAVADTSALVPTVVALNTRLKGVSLYTGLNANSFARFAGVTLAATPSGLIALTGDNDLGQPIAATVTSGVGDFDIPTLKTVLSAYVGYRAAGEMELTLITDQHEENVYRLAPSQKPADLHASRVKFGRGVQGRYWQWTLANTGGAAFDLASLDFHVKPKRRGV